MKKTYKVEVDCASCANLMEETAKKINGIKEVTINFLTQKMEVDFDDNKDEKEQKKIIKEVLKACKKVEEDFEIYL